MARIVVCMKWGDKYDARYVNRLLGMCRRNLTLEHRFVCLTDDDAGLLPGIEAFPLPPTLEGKTLPARGAWQKLAVFGKDGAPFAQAGDTVLFLDLDLLVVANIDALFEAEGEFLIIRDWLHPGGEIGNSSVFRFVAGRHHNILDEFRAKSGDYLSRFRNEQSYLSHLLCRDGLLGFWPASWCASFKRSCVPRFPLSLFRGPRLPRDAKIIAFHGRPNPHQARDGYRAWKKLLFVKPAPWIDEYWRE